VLLAPTVNLQRTPYGGRHFECFSEDPLLTARMGIAYVRGLQDNGVGATVKHFVANDSETERYTLDARVDERTLRELYLAPFESIVREAGPWAVMAAYNGVNGHTMTESPLLRGVLKDEWEWDGLVISDWTAARTTEGAGRAALDLVMPGPGGPWGEALVEAVRAGRVPEPAIDDKLQRLLRLAERVGALGGASPPVTPPSFDVGAELRATAAAGMVLARNEGLLPLERSARVALLGPNAAVARTLGGGSATVFPPYTVSPLDGLRAAGVQVMHTPGVHARTRLAAYRGEVEVRFLGRGGDVLRSERRRAGDLMWMGGLEDVAAIELRARVRAEVDGEHRIGCSGLGRFALRLDGRDAFADELALAPGADIATALVCPPQRDVPVALRAGEAVDVELRHALADGGPFVTVQLNVEPPHPPDDEELERAAALAADADAAVVVVGTTEEVESEGFDRESLALPGRQDELVRRVAAANPRTVVVVNAGAPVLMPWADEVPAVLLAWFGGQELGNALADVLLGTVEAGGRLPTTWPRSEAGLPPVRPVDGVLAYDEGLAVGYRAGGDALYPFGHGLGYTEWEYVWLDVAGTTARVRVRNAGARAGREVVQLYLTRDGSAVERPPLWLAGFAAAVAEPGEEVELAVELPRRVFAHWDGGWQVEPGTFTLRAGRSCRDLRLSGAVTV
jgi:beta-glucosidase